MIQMIAGVYGLYKDGRVRGMSRESGPFSVDAAEEARLVGLGIAEYVNIYAAEGEEDAPELPKLPELPDGVVAIPEYSEDSSPKELREIGKLCGLTFKVGTTKAEMVAALDAHIAENTVDGDDMAEDDPAAEGEEDAPTFNAEDAVQ